MATLDFLKDIVEDLATLEVVTLTNPAGETLDLDIPDEKADPDIKAIVAKIDTERDELIKVINSTESEADKKKERKTNIKNQRKVIKELDKELEQMREVKGIYKASEIFKVVKSKLTGGQLVAYSRFELEGDSISFITDDEQLSALTESHKDLVTASQEARKALFETVGKYVKS